MRIAKEVELVESTQMPVVRHAAKQLVLTQKSRDMPHVAFAREEELFVRNVVMEDVHAIDVGITSVTCKFVVLQDIYI